MAINIWLIWSMEHNAWWSPNKCGYTKSRQQAGRYTYSEAMEIVKNANMGTHPDHPNEALIPDF